jgi:hypothetical protein
MDIKHPNAKTASPQELQDLEKLKAILEQATADGKLTKAESESIRHIIWENRKVTLQELELVQKLVWDKIQSGDLEIVW